jgi:hypothetical protein
MKKTSFDLQKIPMLAFRDCLIWIKETDSNKPVGGPLLNIATISGHSR